MRLIKSLNLMENQKVILWLNLVSLPLILLFFLLFRTMTILFPQPETRTIEASIITYIFSIGLLGLVLIVIHELIHGLFFKIFQPTGKVQFGFKNGMAYATSPNSFFTKGKFAWISLAPFICITSGLWLAYWYGWINSFSFIFLASLHGAACVGDFYWIYLLIQAPKKALVEDTEVGINFYEKD